MNRRRSGRSFNYRKHQGGWAWTDWLNLAGQVGSAYLGKKAGDKAAGIANTNSAAQDRLLDTQSNLAAINDARAQEMYDEYMDVALPANRQVLEMARKPINPNVEAATAGADFAAADAVQRGSRRRALQSVGVDPSSGAALEGDRLALLDSTAGRAAASTTARRGATDLQISRVANASQAFNPLIGAASSFSGQASGGYDRTAAAYGRNAQSASAVAGAAGGAFGENLASVVDTISRMWSSRSSAPKTVPPQTKPVVQVDNGYGD